MDQSPVGTLLALSREDARAVFAATRGSAFPIDCVRQLIARLSGTDREQSVGDCWGSLDASLAVGDEESQERQFALQNCLLGGRSLADDAVVKFVRPDLVMHVGRALESLTREEFLRRWERVGSQPSSQSSAGRGPEYWEIVGQIRGFYELAGQRGEAVLFVAISRDPQ